MFFNQEESLELNKYLKNEWVSYSIFCEDIADTYDDVFFKGHGFLSKKQVDQFYPNLGGFILGINDSYYVFLGASENAIIENDWFQFKSIVEVDHSFIKNEVMEKPNSYYNKFESDLLVELKYYKYTDEEKIMVSKKGIGNIDLYASYSYKPNTKKISGKVYPAASNAAKSMLMTNALNERFASVSKENFDVE